MRGGGGAKPLTSWQGAETHVSIAPVGPPPFTISLTVAMVAGGVVLPPAGTHAGVWVPGSSRPPAQPRARTTNESPARKHRNLIGFEGPNVLRRPVSPIRLAELITKDQLGRGWRGTSVVRWCSGARFDRGVLAGAVNPRVGLGAITAGEVLRLVGVAELGDRRRAALRRVPVRVGLHAHRVHDGEVVLVDRPVGDRRGGPGALVDAVDHAGVVRALRLAGAVRQVGRPGVGRVDVDGPAGLEVPVQTARLDDREVVQVVS